MAELIVLPKMTLSMEEGLIGQWYIKEGDVIKIDDPLCSVENEKETDDLMSAYEGTILKLIAEEGGTYPANAPIAVVGEPGEDFSALLAGTEDRAAASATKATEEESALSELYVSAPRPQSSLQGEARVSMMPKVRKLVLEKGIDIDELARFCEGRKITEEEVEAFELFTGL